MAKNPELIAFSQYVIGGLQSFYYNILSNDPYNHFDKKWIFEDDELDLSARLPGKFNCCEEIIFQRHLGFEERPYDIARRLHRHISNREGAVLANFELELMTMHLFRKRKKTIYFICHDECFVPVAQRFSFLIDVFIAHNPFFFDELKRLMPDRYSDIFYILHGVQVQPPRERFNEQQPLRLVFVARLQKSKGVDDLPLIAASLRVKNVPVEWTIIGAGPELDALKVSMPAGTAFMTPENNVGVIEAIKNQDIFLLPSRLDGLPVALLETMSVGCVPLITNFNPGIQKIVTPDIGYVEQTGDIDALVRHIGYLHNNRDKLKELSNNAYQKVLGNFNIKQQAKKYFDLFMRYAELKKPRRRKISFYGGLLSHRLVPKFVAKQIRLIKARQGNRFLILRPPG